MVAHQRPIVVPVHAQVDVGLMIQTFDNESDCKCKQRI